jgi:hypothetical protein
MHSNIPPCTLSVLISKDAFEYPSQFWYLNLWPASKSNRSGKKIKFWRQKHSLKVFYNKVVERGKKIKFWGQNHTLKVFYNKVVEININPPCPQCNLSHKCFLFWKEGNFVTKSFLF